MAKKELLSLKTVDSLLKSLLVLSRSVDRTLETRVVESAAGVPLSTSKVQIFRLLGHRGAQNSSQIARFLGVSKPAVSQIIDGMVASKQVSRKTAREDRREVLINLTKSGRETFRAIQREQRHLIRVAARSVKGGNPRQWTEMCMELSGAIAAAGGTYEQFCLQCRAHDDGTCVVPEEDESCEYLQHRSRSSSRKTGKKTKAKKTSKR